MNLQILRQPMSAHNVVDPVHIMWIFLRKQLKIQEVDGNGRVQILILHPLVKCLIHPRPIVERPLLHIVEIHELNLYVDLTAIARNSINIEL